MPDQARTLIVVEDEPIIAMMVEQMVSELGWHVQGCAYSEREAFSLLENLRPSAALLDINLGIATSLGVASLCRDRGIAVVYITGYSESEIPRRCAGDPVLIKPFSSDELAHVLEAVLLEPS